MRFTLNDRIQDPDDNVGTIVGIYSFLDGGVEREQYKVNFDTMRLPRLLDETALRVYREPTVFQQSWQLMLDQLIDTGGDADRCCTTDYLTYIVENRSVMAQVPRQTGKTTFLSSVDLPGVFMITSSRMKQDFHRTQQTVITLDDIQRRCFVGVGVRGILLDEHTNWYHNEQKSIISEVTAKVLPSIVCDPKDFFVFGLTS